MEENCAFCGELQEDCLCNHHFLLDDLRALFSYTAPVNHWISSLKYRRNFLSGRLLKQLVSEWTEENRNWIDQYDHIEFIPHHWRTQLFRGFNQVAFLYSDILPKSMIHALTKKRRSPHQAAMNLLQRNRLEKSQSFSLKGDFTDMKVLIVDDVCSTGNTLKTTAKLFRDKGSTRVDGLVIARNLT